MNDGCGQFDMAHAFTAHSTVSHLDAAAIADHPLVLHATVFAACALPVLFRAENPFTEESVTFRTIRSIVDRFRFLDFTEGPAANIVRTGKANFHRRIIVDSIESGFTYAHVLTPQHQMFRTSTADVADRRKNTRLN